MYKMTRTDLTLGAYRVIRSDRIAICGLAFVFNLVQVPEVYLSFTLFAGL